MKYTDIDIIESKLISLFKAELRSQKNFHLNTLINNHKEYKPSLCAPIVFTNPGIIL